MTVEFFCRAMRTRDLVDVIRIQAEAYVDEVLEAEEVIYARFAQVPDTSWVVERAGVVCGYLVGYHSILGEVTALGDAFMHKSTSTVLYLHDLAISKSAVGCGLGLMLVNHALEQARQRELRAAALVSVQDSKTFWRKLGFSDGFQLDEGQQKNLASYSSAAIYMTRELAC